MLSLPNLILICRSRLRLLTYIYLLSTNLAIAEQPSKLAGGQGYLLIELDVGGVSPSIEYRKLQRKSHTADFKMTFKNIENRFILLPIAAGNYQITRVNTPLFDLPYALDTQSDPEWRFTIKRNKVNYFGFLKIEEERLERIVGIQRINRLASSYDDIKSEFGEVLESYPLVFHATYRDDFFQDILESTDGGVK